MIALQMLRDWAEATDDARVAPFLERYFRFQRGEFGAYPLSAESRWAVARAGDELDVVLWLYGKTRKDEWREFAKSIAKQSTDWAHYYRRGGNPGDGDRRNGFCSHIVNFMQGLKTPVLQWRLDGDELRFSVWDDGCGFDPERRPGLAEGHFGLQGVRERVSRGGGTLVVESAVGRGTKVKVSLKEHT